MMPTNATPKKSPPPIGEVGGLVRVSDVSYPDGCVTPQQRAAHEAEVRLTRTAELVGDAARDGLTITRWYVDLGVSGRAAGERDRVGLLQLLADARAGRVRVLYARELSRIYRDTVKSILFKTEMLKLGVDVRARDLIRSDDAATETLVQTIQFAVDQFQAERTGIQIRSRNLELFLAGRWPGLARDMWGLRYDPARKAFDLDPATAPLLLGVLGRLVALRGNAYRAALSLNAELLAGAAGATPTPGGAGAMWDAKDVLRLARSPFYRRHGKYGGQTKSLPDLIPEVVPPELIAEVDRVLALRGYAGVKDAEGPGEARRRRGGREVYTYGPLMRCADCGGRMRALRFLGLREKGDPDWLYWTCRQGADSRVLCPHAWAFTQVRLDRLVGEAVRRALAGAMDLCRLEGGAAPRPHPARRAKGDPAAQAALIDAQIERTMRLYTSGLQADFGWVQQEVSRLQARKAALAADRPPSGADPGLDDPGLEAGAMPRIPPGELAALLARIGVAWAGGQADAPMDAPKADLLRSLGVSIAARTVPRTLPPAGRGARRAGARTGGPLHVTVEIPALGMTGARAVAQAEAEEDWYEALRERGRRRWRGTDGGGE